MNVLVLGTGGVGGYFGARLAHSGADVWFLARGAHLEAMKQNGLRVKSTDGEIRVAPGRMTDHIENVPPPDLVLFCVKSYDTESVAASLNAILKSDTVVLSLQNGIDNEEKLEVRLKSGQVYAGVAYVSSRISAPGEITETGGLQRIVFGPFSKPIDRQSRDILDLFVKAGIKAELRQEIVEELWKKFIFITSMGSLTALTRLTHGQMLASPDTMAVVFDAMKEAYLVAHAKGVEIPPVNPETVLEGLRRFDPETRSSMYYDLMSGKPLEIEALNGTVVRLGKQLHVPTPIHRTIYAGLLPHHLKHLQQAVH